MPKKIEPPHGPTLEYERSTNRRHVFDGDILRPSPAARRDSLGRRRKREREAMAKHAKFRSAAEIEKDRAEIARLYSKGVKIHDIAAHVGLSYPLVNHDLKVVIKRWRDQGVRDIDELRGRELMRLNLLEREAWEAWENSKKPTTKEVTEQNEDEISLPASLPERLRKQLAEAMRGEQAMRIKRRGRMETFSPTAGNPAFLDIILAISKRRSDLLGLNKPADSANGLPTLADVVSLAMAAGASLEEPPTARAIAGPRATERPDEYSIADLVTAATVPSKDEDPFDGVYTVMEQQYRAAQADAQPHDKQD